MHQRLNHNSDNGFLVEDHSVFDEEEENVNNQDKSDIEDSTSNQSDWGVEMRFWMSWRIIKKMKISN